MPITLTKLFDPTLLSTTLSPVFTLNESANAILENLVIRVVNTSNGIVHMSGHVIPNGEAASTANAIAFEHSVPAKDYVLLTVPVMRNEDFIEMMAETDAVLSVHHESGMPKSN